jgi:hypothetical protein
MQVLWVHCFLAPIDVGSFGIPDFGKFWSIRDEIERNEKRTA